MGAVTAFRAYDRPLETVSSFNYLGRLPVATDDYCLDFIANILKDRKSWSCLDLILGWKGADTWKLGIFYVAVVLAILLFGSYTWVVNPRIKRLWGGFYYMVVRRVSGNIPW